MYVTLYNVIDIRTGKHHSVVRVKANQAKWFIPENPDPEEVT